MSRRVLELSPVDLVVRQFIRAIKDPEGIRPMRSSTRRRGALIAAAGLLASTLTFAVGGGGVVSAGSQVNTTSCINNATGGYSDIDWTLSGNDAPDPATLGGGDVTLSGGSIQGFVPADLLIAGYNLGLLSVDGPDIPTVNNVPAEIYVSRSASNTAQGVQVDSLSITVQTTITDIDGTPGTGDESATPISIDESLPDMVVTPTGGQITWSQGPSGSIGQLPPGVGSAGGTFVNGSIWIGTTVGIPGVFELKVNFDCFVGTTVIDPVTGDGISYTPATPVPFETTTVTAPPTAPMCTDESVSVGAGQSTTIDLTNNCTDVNGNIDPTTWAVSALTPADPTGGTLTPTATPGVYDYTAPGADPGPVTFTFTVADTGGLVSNTATTTISVLANQCDATAGPCDLTQIVVQPVTGTTMTMDKAPGLVVMTETVLNGGAQVSTGAIQPITVTNARGTAAGWSVTGYVTDLGAPGAPTFSPFPGVTIATCSLAGGGGSPDRLCIPGDNMGWAPASQITHDVIAGDVAAVNPGPADAVDAADWQSKLVGAGSAGVDGIGGLLEANTLCEAPVNQSGGTFQCDASLFLGVPASAGAGDYTGGLVVTLT